MLAHSLDQDLDFHKFPTNCMELVRVLGIRCLAKQALGLIWDKSKLQSVLNVSKTKFAWNYYTDTSK